MNDIPDATRKLYAVRHAIFEFAPNLADTAKTKREESLGNALMVLAYDLVNALIDGAIDPYDYDALHQAMQNVLIEFRK